MTVPIYPVREFRDLKELIRMSVELYADQCAFEMRKGKNEFRQITYREYSEDIDALGTALIDLGLKDAKIAVAGNNCYEWCLSYMAVVSGVGVVVPTDKELLFDDINGIFKRADVSALICDRKFLKKIDRSKLKKDFKIILFSSDEDNADDIIVLEDLIQKGKMLIEQGNREFIDVVINPELMCTLLFTSGTTGASKGVMLCQRNFCSDVMLTMSVVKITPEDCGISMLPLHHTYESTIILFCAPYAGAKITFCDGFKYVLKNMAEFSPSIFVSVPLILETVHRRIMKKINEKPNGMLKFKVGKALCKAGSKVGIDLKKVFFKEIQETFGGKMRLIICGAAPIDPQILKDFDAFGIQILFGYGLTECSPLVIINNDKLTLADSIGVPLPGVEAKIEEPNEQGIGEVVVKGPMVMLGYYKNKEATDEVIDEDGFFHTGDLGRVDKKGRFYITGRCKNVIVTQNGKNIYPEELEYHLSKHHIIKDSLVYADTDRRGNTAVKAKIFPDSDEIKYVLGKDIYSDAEAEELVRQAVEAVNEEVPQFKRITDFSIRKKPFAKTSTQKIQRFKKENMED